MAEDVKVNQFVVRVSQEDAYRFQASFEGKDFAPIALDEPPPLGKDAAPNAARVLAAAIGNCLAASLVFCLGKRGVAVSEGVEARVSMEIVRTPERRLRVGRVHVALRAPDSVPADALAECAAVFEDFCTVTASVRRGIEVDVELARAV